MTLNIETSTNICSAALTEGSQVIASCLTADGNHAHDLPLFVQSLLQTAKDNNKTINAVAVSQGPGSYTGLRIGVATAKGICFGLDVPLLAVDTLQLLAASLLAQYTQLPDSALLCPMLDARRMEVYTALYTTQLQAVTAVEAKIINSESFLDILSEKQLVFFGNGASKCKDIITHDNALFIDNIVQDAKYMGLLAEQKLQAGDFADIAYFAPFYLKEFHATVSHKAQDVLGI
ncbi:MAG: tRNA (adenosine(37)-N6)-threonylcarbamoyltransferase complex dimerization subunit type 1 TsaB [Paludibacteraceae bacterium]|nr:tRNA (adenosine(37)-N6)-threonylcarbamoyltransferase complex dimerization subunit type 1 TsaB [Paludibacteraceae bacterium]